jgi:hypothetical protein
MSDEMPVSPKLTAEKLAELDALIKQGRLDAVQKILEDLPERGLERALLAPLAALARRVGFHRQSIRLLNPIVRPKKGLLKKASPLETLEYAAALVRYRAVHEAAMLLESLDAAENPDVLLHKASLFIYEWNYAGAVPLLEEYVRHPKTGEYQARVGRLNLAESYFFLFRDEDAVKLVNEALESSKNDETHRLLAAKAMEIKVKILMRQKQWGEARAALAEAAGTYGGHHYRYKLYVRMTDAVMALLESPRAEKAAVLAEIRAEAEKLALWEMVRDCDFFRAMAMRDPAVMVKLYFATPFPGYRERMLRLYGEPLKIPHSFDWKLAEGEGSAGEKNGGAHGWLDVVSGVTDTGASLRRNGLLHRLLQILASDFYRPARPEFLFATLYPGEFFDPVHFQEKIHNLLKRLRLFFKEAGVPLQITEEHGEYRIVAEKPYVLRLGAGAAAPTRVEEFVKFARREFRGAAFTRDEIARLAELSETACQRLLNKAIDKNAVIRIGKGPATKYRVA